MPRVYTKKKNRAGRDKTCATCGATVQPGENYYQWSFRFGGTYYGCKDHYPKQSQLTQSKMGTVYAAFEGADFAACETVAEVTQLVNDIADTVQEVADEYREADEAFGGQGATESAERADELEGFASELEDFDAEEPDDPEEWDQEEWDAENPLEDFEGDEQARSDALEEAKAAHERENAEALEEALEAAREAGQEALDACPF